MRLHQASIDATLRKGSTYLEVQVALLVFVVGISGLVPLSVMNTRQVVNLRERVDPDITNYVVPPENEWAAKLGATAEFSSSPPPTNTTPVELVDDRDAGFKTINKGSYDWYRLNYSPAFRGQFWLNYHDAVGDRCIWRLTDLEPCKYEVLITYPALGFQASDARFIVFDGPTNLGAVKVNQRQIPSGPVYQGVRWESLGEFVINSGTLRVILRDKANGYVAADAVRIVPIKNSVNINAVFEDQEKQSMTVQATVTPPS